MCLGSSSEVWSVGGERACISARVSVDALSNQSIETILPSGDSQVAHDPAKIVILFESTVVRWVGIRKKSGVYQAPPRGAVGSAARICLLR